MSGQRPSPTIKEREIFFAMLDLPSPAGRAAYLDEACGQDLALRAAVEDLLRYHKEDNFLETPLLTNPRASTTTQPPDNGSGRQVYYRPGTWIGPYKILQEIGEGGVGTVFLAEQEVPIRRRVALKVIKAGMDTRSVIARFEIERQALAMMDHPNIAKVLDAGATEAGRPYFVMELVRGIRITDYCDQNHLPTRERLYLFIKVCQAIQHAHQKGIIHRDIKPSNILVTLHDSVPFPKIIDFGIAKAIDQRLSEKTVLTQFHALIGTPAYMSPEQAEMSGLDIDTRSDIYSLGVLLYELLTGQTPFDADELLTSGLDSMRRTIREREPVPPSTRVRTMLASDVAATARRRQTEASQLTRLFQGDLDWIVMKALEKERTRRYATASELAMDIQRFLDNEPVLARPPSNLYVLQKLFRRHRRAVGAAAAIVATLLVGVATSTWLAVRATRAEHQAQFARQQEARLRRLAERAREQALENEALARRNEYVADINLAYHSLAAGNFGRAIQLLEKHQPKPGETDLRGFEWRYLWHLSRGNEHFEFPNQDGTILATAFSPDGAILAVGLQHSVNLWQVSTRTLITRLSKGGLSLAFFPDGQTLVTASPTTVRVWRTSDWSEHTSLSDNSGPVALSHDAALLATTSREGVRMWDTSTWQQLRLLAGASGPLAFSPDDQWLATDTRGGITLWPLQHGPDPRVLEGSANFFEGRGRWLKRARALAFTPDGRSIISTRSSLTVNGVFVLCIWDALTGQEIAIMPDDTQRPEHTSSITSLTFSPDGQILATTSFDHSIRLWDVPARRHHATLHGHLNEVWVADFSPDGQALASGGKDGGLFLWSLQPQTNQDFMAGHWQPLAFSRQGRTLAALGRQNHLAFLNVATREIERVFELDRSPEPFLPPALALDSDLKLLAEGMPDGKVKLWNTDTRENSLKKVSAGRVDYVALSPDGQILITGEFNRLLTWWDLGLSTNAPLHLAGQRVLFTPDGRTLAVLQRGDTVQMWDVAARAPLNRPLMKLPSSFNVALSSDGHLLATKTEPNEYDNEIQLWDTRTGKLVGICQGHKQPPSVVAFSPDGKTLASASMDSTLKLWNVDTQQELLTIQRLGTSLVSLMFSPDGQLLVGSSPFSSTGGLWFHRAPPLRETESLPKPNGD